MGKAVTLTIQKRTPAILYDGYRVKHWIETTDTPPIDGRPEIHVLAESAVYMTEQIQRLMFALFQSILQGYMSLEDIKRKYRVLYDYMRAFSNHTGFGGEEAVPPLPPRWDHINNLNAGAELPAFDKVRVCGGAFLKGYERDGYLIVQTLNPNNVPSLSWLLDNPHFYFHAVLAYKDAAQPFPQANGLPVLVPLFAKPGVVAKIHLSKVQRWVSTELPNPYRIGG